MNMPLSQQVCSLEYAQRLKELGVKQESLFSWWHKWEGSSDKDAGKDIVTVTQHSNTVFVAAAFTVSELGEMLQQVEVEGDWYIPISYRFTNEPPSYECELLHRKMLKHSLHKTIEMTEADARAGMLIYLLENGLLKL